jgi:alpha-tubulin suppressor-like RCC1 family protein
MNETSAGAGGRTGALLAGVAVAAVACISVCAEAEAARISTGASSACLIVSGGHIQCWGTNGSGQLGDGTNVRSATPVEVAGVTGALDVSAGEADACAVLASGHVDCWGSNSDGALGNGSHGSLSESPVEVTGITDAVQVAVGHNHACAVLLSGRVDCWGAKTIEAIDWPSYTPVEVPGIDNATQATVGRSHSCALLSTGRVKCWEEDFHDELGDGRTGRASETPVEVHGVTGASKIAAGEEHTCALLSTGHIACWGGNQEGQLGDGTTGTSSLATEVSGVRDAISLAAGGADSCAVTSTRRVECWGNNYYGQFDDGTIRGSDIPVEAHDLTGVAELAVAGSFTCALYSTGSAACWGDNELDQLGYGVDGGERNAPIAVHGLTGALQVAVGWPHACAVLSSGQLDCWGENAYGELGDATTERKEAPVTVHGLSQVVQVSAGEHDSCAVLATGRVVCWGGGNWEVGQLGDGTYGGSTTPVEVKNITSATEVATETYGSCALLSDGHVNCWGSGFGGSLGNGTVDNPSDIPVEVHGVVDAVQIAAGEEHFCVVLASRRVECWGGNTNGQLGNGTDGLSDVPVEAHGLSDATQVAAGYEFTCALLSTGHVDCWGENGNGQLGDGTTIGPKLCKETWIACSQVPIEVPGLTGVTHIAAGGNDACAVLTNGHAACWGGDESGQIGDGTLGANGCEDLLCNRDTPTEVRGLTGASEIAVGGNGWFDAQGSACALVSGGALECWGSNSGGVLGDDLAWSTTPKTVVGSLAAETPGETGATGAPPTGTVERTTLSPAPGAGPATTALPRSGIPPAASPRGAALSFTAAAAAKARVAVRLACRHVGPCKGTVSVTIERPGKRHQSGRASLGAARFALAVGGSERLTLSLNSHARALLAAGETLHTTVTVALSGSSSVRSSTSLTIHPAKR